MFLVKIITWIFRKRLFFCLLNNQSFIRWIQRRMSFVASRKRKDLEANFPKTHDSNPSDNSRTVTYAVNTGIIDASFADRFMLISFRDFVSVMSDKEEKDVSEEDLSTVSKDNKKASLLNEPAKFIDEFNRIQNSFIKNYEKQKENGNNSRVISAITEEIEHNKFQKNTPSSNIRNALTILYRITSCFLTYSRYNSYENNKALTKEEELKATEFLINICLIRKSITKLSHPIVEAAYHYCDDNLLEIRQNYGALTYLWCLSFRDIRTLLLDKGIDESKTKYLMNKILRTFLYFPFIAVFWEKCKSFDYESFKDLNGGFEDSNAKLKEEIIEQIKSRDFTEDKLTKFLQEKQNNRTSYPKKVEKKFRSTLLALATIIEDFDIIPEKIKTFVVERLHKSENSEVLFQILLSNQELDDFPSIRCFGLNDEFFNIDKAMSIFKGKNFIIAQNSFEPTFAGDDGYNDIVHSKYCHTLLIQAIYLKTILFSYKRDTENCKFEDLKKELKLFFETRPCTKKSEETILKLIENQFYKRSLSFADRIADQEFACSFEQDIYELYLYVESNNIDCETRKNFYAFCEMNYTHGY